MYDLQRIIIAFLIVFLFWRFLCCQVRHIGHEIRTPLNVVGVGVDMLIKDLEPLASMLPEGVMDTIYGSCH